MRAGIGRGWLAAWATLAAAAMMARGDGPPAPGPATVSGRVVTPDGRPAAGARVSRRLADRADGAAEARADADGRFRLGPMAADHTLPTDVHVDADGWARATIPGDLAPTYPGRDTDLGTIRLDAGRVFTGRVVDVGGAPRAGASVEVNVYRHLRGHTVTDIGPGPLVVTDAAGRFATPPLAVGHLALTVVAPGRQSAGIDRPILPGGTEDVGDLRLEADVPFTATVTDAATGAPLAGAVIGGTVGLEAVTDAAGRFTLRGLGPDASFQLRVTKEGYAGLVGLVGVTEAGATYRIGAASGHPPIPTARELVIPLMRGGAIEGRAVDADTGAPVPLDRVVVCNFERGPGGEVVLRGCRSDFRQDAPGQFRATYPSPDEYHLTLVAAGYHDGEAFTPRVDDFRTIGGIVVPMRRLAADPATVPTAPRQRIVGTIARDGQPVRAGWAGLWALRRPGSPVNAPVRRGRMVGPEAIRYAQSPIAVDGTYALDVPFQGDWYVAVDEPGRPLAQAGPVAVGLREERALDVVVAPPAAIRGRVAGIPPAWAGHAHVVAFGRGGIQAEARVEPDGTFALPPLAPGEYGLKAGHDAHADAETYPGRADQIPREALQEVADPWKRAARVTVEPGRDVEGVAVAWPE